jgi:hypothetical protein
MPFDPALPQENTLADAVQMRAQFNGLNDKIDAIASTSNNTNSVPTMDTPFTNDPPTLADMELMRANYNALVTALRR